MSQRLRLPPGIPGFDDDGWPDELRIPNETEFLHGDWVQFGGKADRLTSLLDQMLWAQNHVCGTQCCLVGWMGVAFLGPTYPGDDGPIGSDEPTPAHLRFAKTYLDVAGVRIYYLDDADSIRILTVLSNLFEHGPPDRRRRPEETRFPRLSPKQARAWWIETARRCGYDVRAFMTKEVRAMAKNTVHDLASIPGALV